MSRVRGNKRQRDVDSGADSSPEMGLGSKRVSKWSVEKTIEVSSSDSSNKGINEMVEVTVTETRIKIQSRHRRMEIFVSKALSLGRTSNPMTLSRTSNPMALGRTSNPMTLGRTSNPMTLGHTSNPMPLLSSSVKQEANWALPDDEYKELWEAIPRRPKANENDAISKILADSKKNSEDARQQLINQNLALERALRSKISGFRNRVESFVKVANKQLIKDREQMLKTQHKLRNEMAATLKNMVKKEW